MQHSMGQYFQSVVSKLKYDMNGSGGGGDSIPKYIWEMLD